MTKKELLENKAFQSADDNAEIMLESAIRYKLRSVRIGDMLGVNGKRMLFLSVKAR